MRGGNHELCNGLPDDTLKRILEHIRAHYSDVREKGSITAGRTSSCKLTPIQESE